MFFLSDFSGNFLYKVTSDQVEAASKKCKTDDTNTVTRHEVKEDEHTTTIPVG